MSLLARVRASASKPDWDHPSFGSTARTYSTAAGVPVNADYAMTLSAFWRGVRLIASNVASFPCHIYEYLDRGGRRVAARHPIDDLVHHSPNAIHSAFAFWEMMTAHVILRGHAFARIVPGLRGFADQLVPIHPDLVTYDVGPSGTLQFLVLENGRQKSYGPSDIFFLPGLTLDGVHGVSVIQYGAQAFGTMLGAERFAGRFFKTGATAALAVVHPEEIGKEGLDNLRSTVQGYATGIDNSFAVLTLEEGVKVERIGINPEDAQLLETRQFTVPQVAQWLDLHPAVLGDDKTSTYAATVQFRQDLVDLTFRPWCERIEAAVDHQLILRPDLYFCKFTLDALMRGAPKERADVENIRITNGTMTRNEARILNDREPLPGLDEPLEPLNMVRSSDRASAVVLDVATRLVRKEVAVTRKAAERHADDATAWQGFLRDFYTKHAEEIADRLHLPTSVARAYAARQGLALQAGITVATDWESTMSPVLAQLALHPDQWPAWMKEEAR